MVCVLERPFAAEGLVDLEEVAFELSERLLYDRHLLALPSLDVHHGDKRVA